MAWFALSILGALFAATYYASIKRLLKDIDQYVLAAGAFLSCFLVLFLVSIIKGMPEIGSAFYISVLGTVIINVIGVTFFHRILRVTDLSLVMPMIAFTPLFLILTSYIFLKETPTIFGAAGISLVVVGSYVLNSNKRKTHFLDPFKEIFRNKITFYVLIIAFLYSISVNFDKLVVLNSDPIFGSSIVYLLLGISFLVISSVKSREKKVMYRKNIPKFLLLGLALALVAITINTAYTMQIASYVISLKRLSILFSVFYGGLIFKEKNIPKRGLAALIMLAGTIFIIFS
jgi:drug/metabolite transporter (DMT)-like permease